jgi:hypothetical protein
MPREIGAKRRKKRSRHSQLPCDSRRARQNIAHCGAAQISRQL